MPWLLAALLSAFFYGVWGFLCKISSIQLGPVPALFYQALGGLLVAVTAVALKRSEEGSASAGEIAQAVGVGAVGMIATLFFLAALNKGSVSVVNTIVALSPIVTILLAFVLLGESFSWRHGLGMIFGLIAIGLLTQG
jgi:transporter family protein